MFHNDTGGICTGTSRAALYLALQNRWPSLTKTLARVQMGCTNYIVHDAGH